MLNRTRWKSKLPTWSQTNFNCCDDTIFEEIIKFNTKASHVVKINLYVHPLKENKHYEIFADLCDRLN